MKRISFIGAGNVAWNLAQAFDLAGMTIHEVFSQNKESAKQLAERYGAFYGDDITRLDAAADCIIISVSDQSIHDVLNQIQTIPGFYAHTSGSISVKAMEDRHLKGGVLYPFQSVAALFREEYHPLPAADLRHSLHG